VARSVAQDGVTAAANPAALHGSHTSTSPASASEAQGPAGAARLGAPATPPLTLPRPLGRAPIATTPSGRPTHTPGGIVEIVFGVKIRHACWVPFSTPSPPFQLAQRQPHRHPPAHPEGRPASGFGTRGAGLANPAAHPARETVQRVLPRWHSEPREFSREPGLLEPRPAALAHQPCHADCVRRAAHHLPRVPVEAGGRADRGQLAQSTPAPDVQPRR
jgi:hypothetical protein